MSIRAALLVVIDRTQTALGRAGPEDGFSRIVCVREHRVGLSHGFRVPVETIRSQAVHTRLVQHGALFRVQFPGHRHRPRVCRIRCDGEGIMLGDPADARTGTGRRARPCAESTRRARIRDNLPHLGVRIRTGDPGIRHRNPGGRQGLAAAAGITIIVQEAQM